jgi:hypothetical protein
VVGAAVTKSETGYEAVLSGEARTFSETVVGPGLPAWLRACRFEEWTRATLDNYYPSLFGAGSNTATNQQPDSDEPLWGVLFCNPGPEALGINPGITLTGILASWQLGTNPPAIVGQVLIARAYASIELPLQVGQSAPFGDNNAPLITQLPTWLWIDPALWTPRSATPPPVFGITVTATATPINVRFEGADGEQVDCGPNLGPAYNFNIAEQDQHSDCTLTYHHSSAVADYTMTSTITWEANYICSALCGAGSLPPFVITTTRNMRVAELQAILIPPRINP